MKNKEWVQKYIKQNEMVTRQQHEKVNKPAWDNMQIMNQPIFGNKPELTLSKQ